MNTVRDYIESLFLGVPINEKTNQLKEDLLASSEDRYEDLKKQGKSENEAIGTVISEFGNIDELLEEMNLKQDYKTENGFEVDEISVEEATAFLNVQRRGAILIGSGVTIIIFGLSLFFVMHALFLNGFGNGLSLLFLFVGAAIGVPCFIIAGTSMSNSSKQLDDRLIAIQVKNEVKKMKENFQRSFVICMVFGVSLCILSLAPLLLITGIFESHLKLEFYESLGLGLMFLLVGSGVFFFIFGGVIMGSFTKLLEQTYFISDEDHIGPRAKAELDKNKPYFFLVIERIYWPVIVCIYLLQSFILGNWGTSWLIFPIAGILFGVLESFSKKS